MTSPSAPDWPWSASHRATASPQSSSGDGTSGEYDLVVGAQRLLGTSEIFLIHRTDCGMLTFKNDDVRSQLQQETVLQSAVAGRADCVLRTDGGVGRRR